MKIVVNARFLRKNSLDGIGWFTYNSLLYITRENPHITFYFLVDTDIDPQFLFSDNIKAIKVFPPAKHAFLNVIWFEYSVKRILNRIQPDLFLSMDGLLCSGWKGPQMGVIHDINYVHLPNDIKWTNRWYFNTFYPGYAKLAKRIATVSEYSKQDIVKVYHIPESKVDVVYNGINSIFFPIDEAAQQQVREKYTGGKPYFVFVGTISPRKNIYRLIQAFSLFKERVPNDTKLLLVGWEMFKSHELHELVATLACKEDILFTGRSHPDEINGLIGAAICMTFIPYFEGFGIPPLEAMRCHVPVIASTATSIPEVTGNAALQVDPYNVEEIAEAIIKVYTSKDTRDELIRKGIERLSVFSWERTAHLLWDSVKKCCAENHISME
jgi:glycosyltransferase involved in cell wall biosynthesis